MHQRSPSFEPSSFQTLADERPVEHNVGSLHGYTQISAAMCSKK
jgi:hypothetical protein